MGATTAHSYRARGDIKTAALNLMNFPDDVRKTIHHHYNVYKHQESALPTATLSMSWLKEGASVLPDGREIGS